MIIKQTIDIDRCGNTATARRVLRVRNRLYVEVCQSLDATEPTLMRAVCQAVDEFVERAQTRRGYGWEEVDEED